MSSPTDTTPDSDRGSPSGPVACIRDLHVSFAVADGTVQAVRGVDLDLVPGEVLALVGESGSGKSVLGSCLMGLPPESRRTDITGTVTVAGVDMLSGANVTRRNVRRHLLGAVFQDPLTSLDPTMRVQRQLTERPITRARALANLRDAGVPDPQSRLRQWPHELSGGLRQRVMLAMALGGDGRLPGHDSGVTSVDDEDGAPLLIIADEPTTALDVSIQAQILLMFDRMRRDHGCAVLLVTHDLGVAASIADRIAVLYAGRVCEVGPTADVLANPRHPYTERLLNARLDVDRSTAPLAIPGSPPDPTALLPGCAFAPRCDNATAACESQPPLVAETDLPRQVACYHPVEQSRFADEPRLGVAVRAREAAAAAPIAAAASPTGPAALRLDGITKSFRVNGARGERLHAVGGVTLEVPAAGAVALVGESGCGKTTLLRIACGLVRPDAGTVNWGDERRPQLIFQDAGSSLTPWLSIGTQVAERLHGGPRDDRRRRAIELLERVGLDERAARSRPRQLSGGQRQRAVIARALASSPALLVCDEPVSALDASLSVRILELLGDLRRDLGLAILMVTHDLAAARHLADDVLVMYLGRIVEHAPAGVIFDEPRHPYTEGLRAASPTREPGRLAPTLKGEPPSPIGTMSGCAFAGRCALVEPSCREHEQSLVALPGEVSRSVACQVVARSAR